MTAEEAKKVEVQPESPVEPPPSAAVETKPPATEEVKATGDTKVVEKSEPCEEEGSVHRDAELARVATEKKEALIKAWQESEKSKVENSPKEAIAAWENSKKAELEAELKKIVEKLEKKKAKYTEKFKNKIAVVHKTDEEKRAITEAKRGESLLKTNDFGSKWRTTGITPKKLIRWFSN